MADPERITRPRLESESNMLLLHQGPIKMVAVLHAWRARLRRSKRLVLNPFTLEDNKMVSPVGCAPTI